MTTTQHTPGPWELRYEKQGRRIDAVIKLGKASVYFTRGVGQTFEQQQANARLMAAAPTMLGALRAALDAIGDTYDARDNDETGETIRDIIAGAIAAATGEEVAA